MRRFPQASGPHLARAQQLSRHATPITITSLPKLVQQTLLASSTTASPERQAEAVELLANVRKAAAFVSERVERDAEALEAGLPRSAEALQLLDVAAALRTAISRAEQVGAVEAYESLRAVTSLHLEGKGSVYAVEDEEKRRKRLAKKKESIKRKKARDAELKAAAAAAGETAASAPTTELPATIVEEAETEADAEAAQGATETSVMDSLAASMMSLDAHSSASIGSDKDDDEHLSSSTPASSSHGDTPLAASVDALASIETGKLDDVPSQPVASTSRAPSPPPPASVAPSFNWADEVAAELDIDASTAAAIAAARAESPLPPASSVPADDDWQEVVVKPSRVKRAHDTSSSASGPMAPPPHAYETQTFVLRGRGVAGQAPPNRPIHPGHPVPSNLPLTLPFRTTTLGDVAANKSTWGRGNYISGVKSAGYEDRETGPAGPNRPPEPPWTARSPVPYLFNEPGSRSYVDDRTGDRLITARVSLRPLPGLAEANEGAGKRSIRIKHGIVETSVTLRSRPTHSPSAVSPTWLVKEAAIGVKLGSRESDRVTISHPLYEKYEAEMAVLRAQQEAKRAKTEAEAIAADEERRMREAAEAANRERARVEMEVAALAAESKAMQRRQLIAASPVRSPSVAPISTFEAPIAIMPDGSMEQLPVAVVAPAPPAITPPPPSMIPIPIPIAASHGPAPLPQHLPPPGVIPGVPYAGMDGNTYVFDPMTGRVVPFTHDGIASLFAQAGLPPPFPGPLPSSSAGLPRPMPPPPSQQQSRPDSPPAPPAVGLDFFHAQNGAIPPSQSQSQPPPPSSSDDAPPSVPPQSMPPPRPPSVAAPVFAPSFFVPAAKSAKIQIRAPVPGQSRPSPQSRRQQSPVTSLRSSSVAPSEPSSGMDCAGPAGVAHSNGVVYYGAPAPAPGTYGGQNGPSALQLADPAILAAGASKSEGNGSGVYAPPPARDGQVYAGNVASR